MGEIGQCSINPSIQIYRYCAMPYTNYGFGSIQIKQSDLAWNGLMILKSLIILLAIICGSSL